MDGHQSHVIGVLEVIVGIVPFGFQVTTQRNVGQEIHELYFASLFDGAQGEGLDGGEKFLNILPAARTLDGIVLGEVGLDATFDDDAFTEFVGIELSAEFLEVADERCKGTQFAGCSLVDVQVEGFRVFTDLKECLAGRYDACHLVDGGLTDTARRIVDDSLEGFLVGGIGDEA